MCKLLELWTRNKTNKQKKMNLYLKNGEYGDSRSV